MKFFVALVALAAATRVQAGDHGVVPGRTLIICLDPGGKAAAIDPGQAAASRIFGRVGIRLHWRKIERPCREERGIIVTVSLGTPNDLHPGALAYAAPYERTHIVLLLDRVLKAVPPLAVPSLMGHVLAHEIGHMLQGVSRHSSTGIMKTHWDQRDYADMQLGHLRFTEEDIDLTQNGLARLSQTAPSR